MRINPMNKAELQSALGPVYNAVQAYLKAEAKGPFDRKMKRMPWWIEFHNVKPKFALHDFETMDTFAVNLETGEVSKTHYCGSGLSTIDHKFEQLAEGQAVPTGYAVIFITQCGRTSGNMPWTVDIVCTNQFNAIDNVKKLNT